MNRSYSSITTLQKCPNSRGHTRVPQERAICEGCEQTAQAARSRRYNEIDEDRMQHLRQYWMGLRGSSVSAVGAAHRIGQTPAIAAVLVRPVHNAIGVMKSTSRGCLKVIAPSSKHRFVARTRTSSSRNFLPNIQAGIVCRARPVKLLPCRERAPRNASGRGRGRTGHVGRARRRRG
jgi:hypothetical protein